MSDLLERVGIPSVVRVQNRFNSEHYYSMPVLSNPNSKLAVLAGEMLFTDAIYCLAGMGRKEVGEEIKEFYPEPQIGLYDNETGNGFLLNRESGDRERALFTHIEGLPVLEYFYQYWEGNVRVDVREFVWNDVFYQIFKLAKVAQNQTVNILETFQFSANPTQGRVEPAAGGYPPIIVVSYSDHWIAATCTDMNEYYVDDVWQDPTTGSFDETKDQTSNETTNIGLGKNSIGDGDEVCFVFAWSEVSETDAINKAKDALDNYATYQRSSRNYWLDKVRCVLSLPRSLRYNAAVAVMQILAHSYTDGFKIAGFPTWKDNYVRDTAWVAMGLVHFLPEDAKKLLEWFKDVSDFTSGNNWKSDKVTHGVGNPTDYGAAFLIAVGEYYNVTKDLSLITTLYDRIMDMVNWAKSHYVSADKHMQAPHPHDYWDDYTALSSIPKKYESFIDVYWCEALKRAAVYLKAYGDTSNASWCETTSNALKEGLEDYRTPDGGFWYCIDTSDEIQAWAPGLKTYEGTIREAFKVGSDGKAMLDRAAPFQSTLEEYTMKLIWDDGQAGNKITVTLTGVIFPEPSVASPKNAPAYITTRFRAKSATVSIS